MRRRVPFLAVVATVLASGLLLATASFAPAARSCGVVRVVSSMSTARYSVRVTSGSVACSTATRVMGRFLRIGGKSAGWTCHHGSSHSARCTASAGREVRSTYLGRTGDMSY